MSKPWDKLRKPVKSPICNGTWETTRSSAMVSIRFSTSTCVDMAFGHITLPRNQSFRRSDLTELIEFLEELREQLEP